MDFLTTLDPAPPGFRPAVLDKRHLLAGPVALLLHDLAEWQRVPPELAGRLQGVVLTLAQGPCAQPALQPLGDCRWHLALPSAQWPALWPVLQPLLLGWLQAIGSGDAFRQQLVALQHRMERIGREFAVTRQDYNELTAHLQAQVRRLEQAQAALGALNETLEARVVERTADLARANEGLYKALAELKATQNELVRTADLASLGALAAGIAHELNTPLGNALTVATALGHDVQQLRSQHQQGGLRRSALEQYLARTDEIALVLEKNIARAADIVHHIKPLAVDKLSEQRRRFHLHEVVADTVAALSPQLRRSGHRLAVEVDPALELDSFPGAIGTALTNLITNALAHAFPGRSGGRMALRAAGDGNGGLHIEFRDDGIGMTPEVIGRIFEPFFTTQLGRGGSGLGLYITYNQVRRMLGGTVAVSSMPGEGACFRIDLPCRAPASG